jgi:hypothetical protein
MRTRCRFWNQRTSHGDTVLPVTCLTESTETPTFWQTDKATFHVSGAVNMHNVRIWGSQQPHSVMEHVRDSPKVNVWCGVMCNTIIGPFFFAEKIVTGSSYLDMLQLYAFPQLEHLQPNVFFHQDGAPPHWSLDVRRALNSTFPGRWMGRDGPTDWPPRSPDTWRTEFMPLKCETFETSGPGFWKLSVPSLRTCCSGSGRNLITDLIFFVSPTELTYKYIDFFN